MQASAPEPAKKPLQYLENMPENGKVSQIVVLLHGYGRDATLMGKLAGELRARLPQALILMPQAPEEMEAAVSDDNVLRYPAQLRDDEALNLPPATRRKWFSIRGASLQELTSRILKVTSLINDFISQKRDEYGLLDQDVALMGFSQGGVVALYSAYHREGTLACVVGHSTIFMPGTALKSSVPTLYLYGLEDEEFPPSRYEEAARHILAHVPDLSIEAVPSLRHTTNAHSRGLVADYIAAHFK